MTLAKLEVMIHLVETMVLAGAAKAVVGALGVVAVKAKGVETKALVVKMKQKVHVGLSEPGGPGGNEPSSPQILADTVTLFQSGGQIMPNTILLPPHLPPPPPPPGFSDLL